MIKIKSDIFYFAVLGSLTLILVLIFLWLSKLYKDELTRIEDFGEYQITAVTNKHYREFYDMLPTRKERSDYADTTRISYIYFPNMNRSFPAVTVETWEKENRLEFVLDSIKKYQEERATYYAEKINLRKKLGRRYVFFGRQEVDLIQFGTSYFDSLTQNNVRAELNELFLREFSTNIDMYALRDETDTLNIKGLMVAGILTSPRANFYTFVVPNHVKVIIWTLKNNIIFSLLVLLIVILSYVLIISNRNQIRKFSIQKSNFLSMITHELKTPITSLRIIFERLSGSNLIDDPKKVKFYLDMSLKEIKRLSILSDRAIKITLHDQKEMKLNYELFDFGKLAEDVIDTMKILIENSDGSCVLDINGNSLEMSGDKLHITNVIYNLIENAIKYSISSPNIEVLVEGTDDKVVFTVSDNGIGIHQEDITRIFNRHYRVEGGDKYRFDGYGLGLSYVSNVVKKHNGIINVTSTPTIGTSFIVSLPKYI